MTRDFANSYEQKKWEYAVTAYQRQKHYLAILDAFEIKSAAWHRLREHALARMAELLMQYPQLKE